MAPRNGAGTYSVPRSVVTGTTINSGVENANNADIAAALTGSLPRKERLGYRPAQGRSGRSMRLAMPLTPISTAASIA